MVPADLSVAFGVLSVTGDVEWTIKAVSGLMVGSFGVNGDIER